MVTVIGGGKARPIGLIFRKDGDQFFGKTYEECQRFFHIGTLNYNLSLLFDFLNNFDDGDDKLNIFIFIFNFIHI